MRILFLSVFITLLLALAGAAQNKSVYTSTRASACSTISSTSDGAGSYVGECRGVGGFRVRLIEGDIRQTIDIVAPGGKTFVLNFWNIFSSFSTIGDTVEWRLKGGQPIAVIARYNVADPENSQKSTSYLLVSQISRTRSCVTDAVAPGPDQNEKARALADEAAKKPCKIKE